MDVVDEAFSLPDFEDDVPLIPVSSITRSGLEELRNALWNTINPSIP